MNKQNRYKISNNSFSAINDKEILIVEEWGVDAIRVYSSPKNKKIKNEFGIKELKKNENSNFKIIQNGDIIEFINGNLKVEYKDNKLFFYNKNQLILEEYSRKQSNVRRTIGIDDDVKIEYKPSYSLNISPREFKKNYKDSFESIQLFETDINEKIFGMGSYAEENLNKNLGMYELMQRNSQTTIPFYISNKNYGFLWNGSSIGNVSFNKNYKKWVNNNTECIDYVVIVGENPKDIIEKYTFMVGRAPIIKKELLGLWQSKLRYQTTNEVESIYNEYLNRKIKPSVIVIDYFHWTEDGNFEFDDNYWKDIDKLSKKMKETNTELMVSVWPTVSKNSKYYNYYKNNKMLLEPRDNKSKIFDNKDILDFYNDETKKFVSNLLTNNYKTKNIKLFWADQAEPEMNIYEQREYNTSKGNFEKMANRYPYEYLMTIPREEGYPVLIRSAWFNSQKEGSLVWSGDIDSSFKSLREQIQILISMGLSGISWSTTDIAGFHSGDSTTQKFKELMIRWFQFAVFSPVLRMHGDRQPHSQKIGKTGGGVRTSGSSNEIWSFGTEVERILTKYIRIREKLVDYIFKLYEESTNFGYPISRSLFFEFPNDKKAWDDRLSYMFGSDLLISPVIDFEMKKMKVYLPDGNDWINVFNNKVYKGGKDYIIEFSLETLPVFCKKDSYLAKKINYIFN
ncbi:glycosyl hydrolase family 31 [Sneathia vaginalis]|uniref:Glycosyl hydrolase family 31 n=2 Tax=Sneathia vaginalis TaxID=187101 RepID=A0A0E3UTP5_9FUSO|nr:TIM-barrel domain-containing protein [Sneathia vaginalis]AKC95354.1 glycosyl hydrolase family 31 [Sneathia vaginalis]